MSVDSSNAGAVQQIASVDKILAELKLNEIPQIIVLNKTDLTNVADLEVLTRQISLDKDVPYVAVSAIQPKTLCGLVERIGERVDKFEVAAGN